MEVFILRGSAVHFPRNTHLTAKLKRDGLRAQRLHKAMKHKRLNEARPIRPSSLAAGGYTAPYRRAINLSYSSLLLASSVLMNDLPPCFCLEENKGLPATCPIFLPVPLERDMGVVGDDTYVSEYVNL